MSASDDYKQLLDEAWELHQAKNAGYAADNPDPFANFAAAEGWGVKPSTGCLVRMGDKYMRVQHLLKNPDFEQVGESIDDTLADLAAYAQIARLLLRRENAR